MSTIPIDLKTCDRLGLVRSRRRPNGRWTIEKRIPGVVLVDMGRPGAESRWNTLRALRILRSAW